MGRLFFSVHAPAFSLFPIAYYYLSTRPFGGVSVGQPGIEGVGEFVRPTVSGVRGGFRSFCF